MATANVQYFPDGFRLINGGRLNQLFNEDRTGDQTISGAKTFSGTMAFTGPVSFATAPTMPTATVAAAGSTQTDAALVATGFTLVSAADGTKGVKLPLAAAGKVCIIKNNVNAVLKIWPNTSDAINAIAADSAFSIAALTSVYLVAYDAITWYSLPLLPS